MPKNWRSGASRYLNTRPIYEKEWPKLVQTMLEENLIAVITGDGVKWFYGEYIITKKEIMRVWVLSRSQYSRLIDYILVNDCFNLDETL